METQRSQLEIINTQRVLDSYINYKKDTDKFTKHLREKYARENEKNDKRNNNKK